MQGLEGVLPITSSPAVPMQGRSWDGAFADRGCLSHLGLSVGHKCLPHCSHGWVHVDQSVSITEKQCLHDNVRDRCCLVFHRINLAYYNSPAVPQGLECPSRLVSVLQFVCGWCEGLPACCVRVTPLHDCTFSGLAWTCVLWYQASGSSMYL